MSSEIIQSVVCHNYNDFQHVNFIFSQISFCYFEDYLTDLSVRYVCNDLGGEGKKVVAIHHIFKVKFYSNVKNIMKNKTFCHIYFVF
jgi:hypothetical protein